ncbi:MULTISPECIES: aldehyde dehydrogenase family protein, partial [Halomonadaceae]|uniref:aldehyde dehydrogenase family protein n=1 Tax=Halomonadaceae TaxID=28256 RepID=UPI001583F2DA
FSLIYGSGNDIGQALVRDARIKAVGFTGSRNGGTALAKAAQERPEPIPVYAEMSSINPVFLLPEALESRGKELGEAFIGSLNMGAGQFCTNPGLVIAVKGEALDAFVASAGEAVKGAAAQTMLTPGIHEAYTQGVDGLIQSSHAREVARGPASDGPNACQVGLFVASAEDFLTDEALQAEVFGATS